MGFGKKSKNMFRKSILQIIEKEGEALCGKYKAWGCGEGFKVKGGVQTKDKALVFWVKTKLPDTQLLAEEKIPKKIGGFFGVKTDVEVMPELPEPMINKGYNVIFGKRISDNVANTSSNYPLNEKPETMSGHRTKHRPVVGGTSAKVAGGTAGSLGLVAFHNNKPVALTNEHTIHFPSGQNRKGASYLQPSPLDIKVNFRCKDCKHEWR